MTIILWSHILLFFQILLRKFKLKEGISPKFCNARPVPYAIREKVGEQLNKMEEQGVISKVSHSWWATPIVCIAKTDGGVWICKNYHATVNRAINVDVYPFPTTQDLFVWLAGGKKFAKLDLSSAYEQLKAAPEFREMLTINIRKGLYNVNCCSGCLLDAIIMTGKDDQEHRQNLDKVLDRLGKIQYTFKVKEICIQAR